MENASNNNWLTLLRRKIQKKFKRNRQKVNNVEEVAENPESETVAAEVDNQNIEATAEELPIEVDTVDETTNCEEMKKELFKLNWFWPNLK